jgi:16S rRNA G966 N2-methylase RsmD
LEEQLPLQNKCSLFVGDLLELKSRIRFDLIFLDPPYFHGLAAGAVQHLLLNKNICEGAVLIIECAKKESALIDKQIQILGMRNIVSKTYGKISIHFYTCGEHTQP